jgi:diketogulonate reductase-like aldo/keto reductase
LYENEIEVGEGLRASGVRRDEVFITTKITSSHFAARELERAAKDCLTRLRVSEVDLLLLHWPKSEVPLSETVGALCAVKRAGLTRHIGVSNFTAADIQEAVRHASEPFVCNQIEMNPFRDQPEVTAACRTYDMAVVAYSPIARGQASDDAVLVRIGRVHGKSGAQISLRWLVQQGIPVIPRTSRNERLFENYAIFDFELSDAEMSEISSAARHRTRVADMISPLRRFAYKILPEPTISALRTRFHRARQFLS